MSDNNDEIMNEEDAVLKRHRYPNGTDGDWDQSENIHLTWGSGTSLSNFKMVTCVWEEASIEIKNARGLRIAEVQMDEIMFKRAWKRVTRKVGPMSDRIRLITLRKVPMGERLVPTLTHFEGKYGLRMLAWSQDGKEYKVPKSTEMVVDVHAIIEQPGCTRIDIPEGLVLSEFTMQDLDGQDQVDSRYLTVKMAWSVETVMIDIPIGLFGLSPMEKEVDVYPRYRKVVEDRFKSAPIEIQIMMTLMRVRAVGRGKDRHWLIQGVDTPGLSQKIQAWVGNLRATVPDEGVERYNFISPLEVPGGKKVHITDHPAEGAVEGHKLVEKALEEGSREARDLTSVIIKITLPPGQKPEPMSVYKVARRLEGDDGVKGRLVVLDVLPYIRQRINERGTEWMCTFVMEDEEMASRLEMIGEELSLIHI